MATQLQFRTEQAANSILRNAPRSKPDWAILDASTCPTDIAQLADDMQVADLAYRHAKSSLEAALGDKAVIPSGKRLIVTTGRATGPDAAPILFAIVDGSTSKSTRVVSFDQFVKA